MKPIKKIKAFTISELIVVLILTSIVVGLAFSVLGLVQKQIFPIQNNYKHQMTLRQLETSLWIDIHRYPNINYNPIEEELTMKHELDSVVYQFSKVNIIKAQDTFPVVLSQKAFYFNGTTTNNNKVDAIKLTTDKTTNFQELFIFKKNDATQFMSEE